jgi:hypothetical protein
MRPLTFFEFFAGGGMARAGLGDSWRCVLANDIDAKKGASYAANWGAEGLRVCDIADLTSDDMPERPDLAWLSPPARTSPWLAGHVAVDPTFSSASLETGIERRNACSPAAGSNVIPVLC